MQRRFVVKGLGLGFRVRHVSDALRVKAVRFSIMEGVACTRRRSCRSYSDMDSPGSPCGQPDGFFVRRQLADTSVAAFDGPAGDWICVVE